MKNEVITIDLGSNSFRVLKYDCLNFKIIDEYHQVVGLADGLINSGLISFEALNRVIDAINIVKDKLSFNPRRCSLCNYCCYEKSKKLTRSIRFY